MNHMTITDFLGLQEVINNSLQLPMEGSLTDFPNMWALSFDDDLVKTIQLYDLKKFLSELLQNRRMQLAQKDPALKAKFYLWFDEQALQLRFNLLFDIDSPLLFGCKLKIVPTATLILEEFLTCTYQAVTQEQVIDFVDLHEDQDDDDYDKTYVLKVYVELLQNS